jgi:hypothetical protein
MGIRKDLSLHTTAFRRGYNVPDYIREGIVQTAWEIIQDPDSKKREKISAMRLILSADMVDHQTQRSDKEVEIALLALADTKDIKDEVLRIIEAGTGGTDSSAHIEEQG